MPSVQRHLLASVHHALDQHGRRGDVRSAGRRRSRRRECRRTRAGRPSSSRRPAACRRSPRCRAGRRPPRSRSSARAPSGRPCTSSRSDFEHLEDAPVARHPEVAEVVLEDRERGVVEQALAVGHRLDAVLDAAHAAAEGAHPQHAVPVLVERQDVVLLQAVGSSCRSSPRRRGCASGPRCPQSRASPDREKQDALDRPRCRPGSRARYGWSFPPASSASPCTGADPQRAVRRLDQRRERPGSSTRSGSGMFVTRPVVDPAEAARRADPDAAVAALGQRHDHVVGQAVLRREGRRGGRRPGA